MDGSPFNRSAITRRSPPPTPSRQLPAPAPMQQEEEPPEMVPTSEIQSWMISIEHCLNEVCSISSEGKLNSEQKLKINNLCRKVSHGTSQLAVQYQALKQKTIQTHMSLQALKDNQDLSQRLREIKESIEESSKPMTTSISFADMVKKSSYNFIQPNNTSSVAIYPTDKTKSSEETKFLGQKLI